MWPQLGYIGTGDIVEIRPRFDNMADCFQRSHPLKAAWDYTRALNGRAFAAMQENPDLVPEIIFAVRPVRPGDFSRPFWDCTPRRMRDDQLLSEHIFITAQNSLMPEWQLLRAMADSRREKLGENGVKYFDPVRGMVFLPHTRPAWA